MPASFWFEIRGTETYFSHPKTKTRYGSLSEDYTVTTEHTREEFLRAKARGNKETKTRGRIWQKRDIENLQRVDELICEFMGDPAPDVKRDSEWYYWIHQNAFWTMYGHDKEGSNFPEHRMEALHQRLDETFDAIKEKDAEAYAERYEKLRNRAHGMIDWALTQRWEYHAHG